MSFDSVAYLLFLPAVVLLHRILPNRYRWVLLLAASTVFYASWNIPLTLLLYSVIGMTYLAAIGIATARSQVWKRVLLALSIMASVGLLLYFKYFAFLANTLSALLGLFGVHPEWQLWDILLPVGVSFYTFQAMSYVIDVYRGDLPAERHFGYYALYISFFPQLVAGPIERATTLLPQLRKERTVSRADVQAGCSMLLSGFFRKIVLADFCGTIVTRVYAAPAPDGSAVLVGTLLFSVQIYCDFAGYSEIARGSARLLGIRLMRNFDRPYLSESIRDFWRRWHISLSKWLTDYVYIPLGGSKSGLPTQILATLLVFLLSGLWHGANVTFVVWGLLHGSAVVFLLILRRMGLGEPRSRFGKGAAVLATFLFVSFCWIFFRAESLSQAALLINRLFSPWDIAKGIDTLGLTGTDVLRLVVSLAASPLLLRLCRDDDRTEESDMTYVYLLLAIAIAFLLRWEQNSVGAFLYFQF